MFGTLAGNVNHFNNNPHYVLVSITGVYTLEDYLAKTPTFKADWIIKEATKRGTPYIIEVEKEKFPQVLWVPFDENLQFLPGVADDIRTRYKGKEGETIDVYLNRARKAAITKIVNVFLAAGFVLNAEEVMCFPPEAGKDPVPVPNGGATIFMLAGYKVVRPWLPSYREEVVAKGGNLESGWVTADGKTVKPTNKGYATHSVRAMGPRPTGDASRDTYAAGAPAYDFADTMVYPLTEGLRRIREKVVPPDARPRPVGSTASVSADVDVD